MNSKKTFARTALTGALLLLGATALADQPPRGPPPIPEEAFTACDGKSDGAACTVELRGNKLEGTCSATPDKRLVCMPANLPPPPQRD